MERFDLTKVWADQDEFNSRIWPDATTFNEQSRQTKELILHLHSECDELLRKVVWKTHRNLDPKPNRAAVVEELVDIWKYLLSLCRVWNVGPDELLAEYWHKSMVVRQRYSEEFIKAIDAPCVILDIDNVLCDYTTGLLDWVQAQEPSLHMKCEELRQLRPWLNASAFGIDEQCWQELKHRFRTTGGKRHLPIMPGAKKFTERLRTHDFKIVLLTSRPIDQYPNIYTDTLYWLTLRDIQFDYIYWATDKVEKILETGIRDHIAFAVDDDPKHLNGYARIGIPCFLYSETGADVGAGITRVLSLDEIEF